MSDETRPTETPELPARSSGHDDTVPASSPPDDARAARSSAPPPSQRYRIGAEIGRGGMGRVVEAFDVQLNRTVALKEVLPRAVGVARRFAREVQITARLEHASIVPLYDSGTTADGRPFYVMRKVGGQPLDERISAARDIGERLVLLPNVLAAIDAIAHAHKRGIIHRDLKPANILVGEHGETVVIDWGLAKVIGETEDDATDDAARVPSAADSLQTQVGAVFGTPGFMPPEQVRGDDLGPHSDVFALGATLYQLLAGSPPIVGKSATEVLDATHQRDIAPIAQLAPGTPPELAAIVDKALARDPVARYPNAGALGEDVRRFLSGQLVAAHRYTRRERLGRFAKRHRAALSVAALASVALAGLAWISVHHVLTERDAAETARDELDVERQGLVLENARNRAEEQPTHAVAMLKRIPSSSKNAPIAYGIAATAEARGVAWAMRTGDDLTSFAELDRDARRLVQTTLGGTVRVYNLDTRRTVMTREFSRGARARWIANGKLLVAQHDRAPELVDPDTGSSEKLALPPLLVVDSDADAAHLVAFDRGRAFVLDTATRELAPLADREMKNAAISPDGAYYAVSDDNVVIVFDRDRREILRRDTGALLLAFSPRGQLATVSDDARTVEEIDLGATSRRWNKVPTDADTFVMTIGYRGRALRMLVQLDYIEWDGTRIARSQRLGGYTASSATCADDVYVIAGTTGKLHYFATSGSGTLDLPTQMPGVQLACRLGSPRLVAIGRGTIAVYDLTTVVPVEISTEQSTLVAWLDDRTVLLYSTDFEAQWHWLDITTRALEPAKFDAIWIRPTWSDLEGGRILLLHDVKNAKGVTPARAAIVTRHSARLLDIPPDAIVRLMPGDAIAVARGARITARVGDGPIREVAALDADIRSLARAGLGFAAATATGELVRGSIVAGVTERAHVDVPAGAEVLISPDRDGPMYVAVDRELYVWDRTVAHVATMPKPIAGLIANERGVVVELADREILFIAAGQSVRHRLLPSAPDVPWTAGGQRRIATLEPNGQLVVVDVPSLARWTTSRRLRVGDAVLSMSPDGRHLVQSNEQRFVLWTLAPPVSDLAEQLDGLTNAVIDADRELAWPWQISGTLPSQ
jgi:hypothetical protein